MNRKINGSVLYIYISLPLFVLNKLRFSEYKVEELHFIFCIISTINWHSLFQKFQCDTLFATVSVFYKYENCFHAVNRFPIQI